MRRSPPLAIQIDTIKIIIAMKQACFTFCCTGLGKSLSGSGGDRARAAVKGVSESELMVYKKYCSFPQYSNISRAEFTEELLTHSDLLSNDPLAKLVFGTINGADDSSHHFLAHSVSALPDKETNRDGNYFSHLIYPLPKSWTVRTALEMWGSPFWITCDSDEMSSEMPLINEKDIQMGVVNQETFVQSLRSSPERQKKFLFLIKSLLTLDSNKKVVLTGLPEDMVICLWGATRCLPSSMWINIAFSTHEKPSLSFSFNVVNFFLPEASDAQDEIVFKELSQRQNILFYSENPQFPSSELPENAFAEDILEICLNNSFETLDKFYRIVPANMKSSGGSLQLCWKFLNQPDRISCQDIEMAIEIPELRNRAINALMNDIQFSLDDQLKFYQFVNPELQDRMLNRLISENSIEQIRNNSEYSQLLISALSIPEEPQEEEPQSLFQRIIEFFKKALFG